MSSRQAPPDLARELLEEIDSPCLGTLGVPSQNLVSRFQINQAFLEPAV
jgi:hypothetical protein